MNLRLSYFIVLVVTAVSPAVADVTVIYDSGATHSLAPYLKPLQKKALDTPPKQASIPRLTLDELRNRLPVRSSQLRSGELTSTQLAEDVQARLARSNPRPLFLVGADTRSITWLAQHRERLQELGAAGILVQAETAAEVERVYDVAEGLPITLVSGNGVAEALGIDAYPLLITRDGLSQ